MEIKKIIFIKEQDEVINEQIIHPNLNKITVNASKIMKKYTLKNRQFFCIEMSKYIFLLGLYFPHEQIFNATFF